MAPRRNNATNSRATGQLSNADITSKSPSPHLNSMTGDTSEQEESQNSPKTKMQKLMEDMEGAQRKRRTANKQRVTKAYAKAQADTRASINALFDNHQIQTAEAYDAQISRLKSLTDQKARIEKAMREKLGDMRRDYLASSGALKKVVEYRCKEFR
ncbi:hypothetical protein DM02DRAFT_673871 [Periconia macrospinosa]|uniref:Uncharacterized protein n=1 Tax=Periconia macrospinosa TaxID=97972 RepID=A0A2V1DI00_9PLEO|nr:hypothetical protein DM02DRAFT_673871 [Periconia macrospinosa]